MDDQICDCFGTKDFWNQLEILLDNPWWPSYFFKRPFLFPFLLRFFRYKQRVLFYAIIAMGWLAWLTGTWAAFPSRFWTQKSISLTNLLDVLKLDNTPFRLRRIPYSAVTSLICFFFPSQNISKSSMLWQGWGATGVGDSDFANVNVWEPLAFCESTPDSTNLVSQVFAIKTLKSSSRFLLVESPESLRFFSFVYPSIIQE